jgi:hypothetical protein
MFAKGNPGSDVLDQNRQLISWFIRRNSLLTVAFHLPVQALVAASLVTRAWQEISVCTPMNLTNLFSELPQRTLRSLLMVYGTGAVLSWSLHVLAVPVACTPR